MSTEKTYRPELVVYVVWHPNFALGREFAAFLSDRLTRDANEPLSRGLGIPVYLRTGMASDLLPEPVPFDQAEHTIVVLLVDDEMTLARDDGWEQYAESLVNGVGAGEHRLIPVKLSPSAFSLHCEVQKRNFLPIIREMPVWQQKQRLLIGVVHDLCRLLSGAGQVNYESQDASIQKPVSVFLSHAKKDGVELAQRFKTFLQNELQLDTFFDQNGIIYGDDFADVLEQGTKKSALLIFQTDAYSTREWCQKEVLFAKKYHSPVLVLDHVEQSEARSFPYLGNVPTLRYKPETPIEEIIGRLLLEVLRSEYFPKQARRKAELFGIHLTEVMLLSQSPELINLVPPSATPRTVIYPDPPLGNHEIELLKSCDPNSRLITPMFLVANLTTDPGAKPLVGLSLSETALGPKFAEDLERLGFLPSHFEDVFNEVTRFLLASGMNLAYGGDPRHGGFTERLNGLARQYSEQNHDPALRVEIFLAWIVHISQPAEALLGVKTNARMRRLALPVDLVTELKIDARQPPPSTLTQAEKEYLAARCFTAMREAMQVKKGTESHNTINARILSGGPLAGYAGRYPGLMEEAYFALKANLPTYLIGAFGGCTRAIIDALEGRKPESITLKGQVVLDEDYRNQHPNKVRSPYGQRVADFNTRAARHGLELIDYDAMLSVFEAAGANSLAALSASNGLSADENRRLFETPHLAEIIYLVLKGLGSVAERI